MSQNQSQADGSDFSTGVDLSALVDGAILSGHVGGEPALLIRRGAEIFAIGAACTHYHGPLAEGLVVEDTIRCPWHHACFSLRTGEAVRAPALNPVVCWRTETVGNRVYARELLSPPQKAGPTLCGAPKSVIILGGGAAGEAAAEMLRREGYAGPVTLLSADAALPCDRPNLSKDYLAGTVPEDWIPLRPADFYKAQGIELHLRARAAAIAPAEGYVELEDGRRFRYGALLLATGAEPVRLPVPGADLPHVYYLRTLADSRAIIAATANARRAVVIGASFIGLEVAASLRNRNIEVHVVAPEPIPMERILGAELGKLVRSLHEEHGVIFHLGQTVAAIEEHGVALGSGETLDADIVIIGIGVRPVVDLAEKAGIAVDRGILVNEYLETSQPGIFAAGDIARWPDPLSGERIRVEHWVVAQRQGQTAARNILGRRERFAAVPFFWSQHYDTVIAYVGHAATWDRTEIEGSVAQRDCAVTYSRGGRKLAVATVFRDLDSLQAEVALERMIA
jgi:apoptosis-inducing factor 3